MDNPKTYYDNTYLGSPVLSARISFLRLINQLLTDGKKEEARAALKRSLETMPDKSIPYDQISVNFIGPALELGEDKIASDIAETMSKRADENLNFAKETGNYGGRNSNLNLYILQSIMTSYQEAEKMEEAKKYELLLQKHYGMAQFPR